MGQVAESGIITEAPRYKTLSRGVDGVPGADTKGVDATVQLFVAGALVVRSLRLDPGGVPNPEAERGRPNDDDRGVSY